MSDEKQEPQLMALLTELVKQFSDYDSPRLRKDGDIVIPLDAVLKKNREAHQNFGKYKQSKLENILTTLNNGCTSEDILTNLSIACTTCI